jgi:hypothetical protein
MPSANLGNILQFISLLGAAFLAVRLFKTGLWRNYPVFFSYFIFRIPNTLWPLFVKNGVTPGDYLYEDLWLFTEPISWVFHILIVVEFCRLFLTRHRGIYSLMRWAMFGSVAVAITISIISLLPKIKPQMTFDTRILGFWFATQRGIDFALAIFLLLLLFFLSRFPVRLNRNILVHATLYTIFFLGNALTMFLRVFAVNGLPLHTVNGVIGILSAVCIFAWIILLTPKGEEVQASFRNLSPRHEQHALRQLESLNATLLKVSVK